MSSLAEFQVPGPFPSPSKPSIGITPGATSPVLRPAASTSRLPAGSGGTGILACHHGPDAQEAVPELKRLAERDPIEDVRRIAREALKKIGK